VRIHILHNAVEGTVHGKKFIGERRSSVYIFVWHLPLLVVSAIDGVAAERGWKGSKSLGSLVRQEASSDANYDSRAINLAA
jgi:hypothetical protein